MEIKDMLDLVLYFFIFFNCLGEQLNFVDLNKDGIDDLIISEPYRSSNSGNESGAIYIFIGGKNFPTGKIDHCSDVASKAIVFDRKQSRFGTSILVGDFEGIGENMLLVSAPRDTYTKLQQGSLYSIQWKP